MRRLSSINDLPVIGLEDLPLLLRQWTIRVVDDEPRTKRHKGRVDMDRVRIPREIHRVNAEIGVVTLKPLH